MAIPPLFTVHATGTVQRPCRKQRVLHHIGSAHRVTPSSATVLYLGPLAPSSVPYHLGFFRQTVNAAAFVDRVAGVRRAAGHTSAVTLIQRFGLALNLNAHIHMIFVDCVQVTQGAGAPVFRAVRSPGAGELQALVQQLGERIGGRLENRGLVERDAEYGWLSGDAPGAGSRDELIGHCITYRIATGCRRECWARRSVPASPARTARWRPPRHPAPVLHPPSARLPCGLLRKCSSPSSLACLSGLAFRTACGKRPIGKQRRQGPVFLARSGAHIAQAYPEA